MNHCQLIFFLLLYFPLNSFGQDPAFSQIENTRTYSHPSDILLKKGFELQMAHRSQWNNIRGAYNTTFFSFFSQHEKMKSGYGVKILQDIEGVGNLKTEDIKFVYRYNLLPFSYYRQRAISIAIEGGVIRKSIDWSKLVFSDQIDPVFGIYQKTEFQFPTFNSVSFFDFGAGFTYRDKFKIGDLKFPFSSSVSFRHVYGDRMESLNGIGTKISCLFTVTTSATINAIEYYGLPLLKPIIRYERQAQLKKITYGSLIGFANELKQNTIYSGLFFANQYNPFSPFNTNSFILLVGFEKLFDKHLLSIAYSYDINATGLGNISTAGTHEITLNMTFSTSPKGFSQPSNIFLKCPDH